MGAHRLSDRTFNFAVCGAPRLSLSDFRPVAITEPGMPDERLMPGPGDAAGGFVRAARIAPPPGS